VVHPVRYLSKRAIVIDFSHFDTCLQACLLIAICVVEAVKPNSSDENSRTATKRYDRAENPDDDKQRQVSLIHLSLLRFALFAFLAGCRDNPK
jgi:hypothetical protein